MFFLVVISIVVFHREIIALLLRAVANPKEASAHPFDLRALALQKMPAQLFLCESNAIEASSLKSFFGIQIFIARRWWERLETSEKECLFLWLYLAAKNESTFKRFFGPYSPEKVDRDTTILISNDSLKKVFDEAILFRGSNPLSFFGSIFSGLSFLGSSVISDWKQPQNRLERLKKYLPSS